MYLLNVYMLNVHPVCDVLINKVNKDSSVADSKSLSTTSALPAIATISWSNPTAISTEAPQRASSLSPAISHCLRVCPWVNLLPFHAVPRLGAIRVPFFRLKECSKRQSCTNIVMTPVGRGKLEQAIHLWTLSLDFWYLLTCSPPVFSPASTVVEPPAPAKASTESRAIFTGPGRHDIWRVGHPQPAPTRSSSASAFPSANHLRVLLGAAAPAPNPG